MLITQELRRPLSSERCIRPSRSTRACLICRSFLSETFTRCCVVVVLCTCQRSRVVLQPAILRRSPCSKTVFCARVLDGEHLMAPVASRAVLPLVHSSTVVTRMGAGLPRSCRVLRITVRLSCYDVCDAEQAWTGSRMGLNLGGDWRRRLPLSIQTCQPTAKPRGASCQLHCGAPSARARPSLRLSTDDCPCSDAAKTPKPST